MVIEPCRCCGHVPELIPNPVVLQGGRVQCQTEGCAQPYAPSRADMYCAIVVWNEKQKES